MQRQPQQRRLRQRCSGYIVADVIIAVAVVAILLTALTVAVSSQRRASERLADSRAAIRFAEETITALQTGAAAPPALPGMTVQVRALSTQPALAAPPGSTWVNVLITFNGRSSNLAGLVRADAAKGAIK